MVFKKRKSKRFQLKFYSNAMIGIAMILATTGLKIPLTPYRRNQHPPAQESLTITNRRGFIHRLPVVSSNHLNTVANFTISTMLSRPQHFIVTPSIHLYNFITKRISWFFRSPAPQTESEGSLDLDRLIDQARPDIDVESPAIDVESHELVTSEVIDASTELSLFGNTMQRDARKMRTAVSLNHPVFIASFDGLLKDMNCNLDTSFVLNALAEALYPTPTPKGIRHINIPQEIRRRLQAFHVVYEDINIDISKHLLTLASKFHIRM